MQRAHFFKATAAAMAVGAAAGAVALTGRASAATPEAKIGAKVADTTKLRHKLAARRAKQNLDNSPKAIAKRLCVARGWDDAEYQALLELWDSESAWDVHATNPDSGAYGIPQALPGDKMASAGSDWQTNPATQIKWGVNYIAERYGTPSAAMEFKFDQGHMWY